MQFSKSRISEQLINSNHDQDDSLLICLSRTGRKTYRNMAMIGAVNVHKSWPLVEIQQL